VREFLGRHVVGQAAVRLAACRRGRTTRRTRPLYIGGEESLPQRLSPITYLRDGRSTHSESRVDLVSTVEHEAATGQRRESRHS
jgi:hypothetical protein